MRTKVLAAALAALTTVLLADTPGAAQPPVPGRPLGVKVFQLKHADAQRTADILTAILNGRGARLAVDDRTNSVVLASDAATAELARALIARLDTPLPPKK
jgi:hypothetical protein